MKNILLTCLVVFSVTMLSSGQDCSFYYPQLAGARLVYQHYDKKLKPAGKSSHEVIAYNKTATGAIAVIKVESFDEKDKLLGESTIEVKCETGGFYFDMKSFISPQTLNAYKDMDIVVTTDNLEMPHLLKAGEKLKDGSLIMDISTNGFRIMTISVLVTDRVVEGQESITTPAGTFSCYKINEKVTSKVGLTVVSNTSEWYCENVGLVKSETYSGDGALASGTELIELNR